MDTRSKILTAGDVAGRTSGKLARWVAGHFDPLLAEHVRRLREAAAPGDLLVVKVTNPPQPLLPQRARAELVAALSMVDFVVMGEEAPAPAQDAGVSESFVEHVVRRHREETAR